MNNENANNRWISIVYGTFQIFFVIMLSTILLLCIGGCEHNLQGNKVLILAIAFAVGILTFSRIYIYIYKSKYHKYKKNIALVSLALLLALGVISILLRCQFWGDAVMVYNTAKDYVCGNATDWSYMKIWNNNIPFFCIVVLAMRIAGMLGIDPFYLLLFLNLFQVIVTFILIYKVVLKLNEKYATLGVILYIMFLPIWVCQQTFYTDQASILFGTLVVFCIWCTDFKHKYYVGGLFFAIGYLIKPTSIIIVVAFFIVLFIKEGKKVIIPFVEFFISSFFILLVYKFCVRYIPCFNRESMPVLYWVGMGMVGNGGYSDNSAYAEYLYLLPTKAERLAHIKDYILENYKAALSFNHIVSKMRFNFASGNMGILSCHPFPDGIGYDFFNMNGRYNGYVTYFTTAYWYSLLILYAAGAIKSFCNLIKRKEISYHLWIYQIAFAGLVVFLMLWEASNRQLYNQIPCLAILGIFSIATIFSSDTEKNSL